jgi:phenylacetate-coenzyme A ligase PaaK-like adenylate-forming protein
MLNKDRENFIRRIFSLSSEHQFEEAALELFRYQAAENQVYRTYLQLLDVRPGKVRRLSAIPFMPVSFFRTHRVVTGEAGTRIIFKSSGTGNYVPSCHHVHDPALYHSSLFRCFELFYGPPRDFCILALLPSYLERGDSSLVYMAGKLIEESAHPDSGFYLDNMADLAARLNSLEGQDGKVLLLGVSFALLDLAESHDLSLKKTIIMETGGMKGRRKEITREELHLILKARTGAGQIHSEYGMTELLSQAYARSEGRFSSPPWMKVMIRDSYDPFSYMPSGRSGGINITDLANLDSCAFVETSDLGRLHADGTFEVIGRFDNSEVRGCNLLSE